MLYVCRYMCICVCVCVSNKTKIPESKIKKKIHLKRVQY